MSVTAAFNNEKYLSEQTSKILERVNQFGDKLYLEFGGKLLYDYHAARVLPGYEPNVKMRLLQQLKADADILLCIYAGDIERKKIRADFGITYELTYQFLLFSNDVPVEHIRNVKEKLVEWERSDGAFLFSKASLHAYRDLVTALSEEPL